MAACQLSRHLTLSSKPVPASASSFTAVLQPHSVMLGDGLEAPLHVKHRAEIGMEDRMDEELPLSLPIWGSSQVTLCESGCRRKMQLRWLWFPLRMSSRFCSKLWHCESCSHQTRTQMPPWTHRRVQTFMRACLFMHGYTHLYIETYVWMFFLFLLNLFLCCHILTHSTVIMTILLVVTNIITW